MIKSIALAATVVFLPLSALADPFEDAHNSCLQAGSVNCIAINEEGITIERITAALNSSPEKIISLNKWDGLVTLKTEIPPEKRFLIAGEV